MPSLIKQIEFSFKKLIEWLETPRRLLRALNFWKNPKIPRQQRKERRLAIHALLTAMLELMDYATGEVALYYTYGGQKRFTLEELAEKAALTLSRVKRAFRDLVRAGYIDRKILCYTKDGKIRAQACFKRFTRKFWQELGISLRSIAKMKEYYKSAREKLLEKSTKDSQLDLQEGRALAWEIASFKDPYDKEPKTSPQKSTAPPTPPKLSSFFFNRTEVAKSHKPPTAQEMQEAQERFKVDPSTSILQHLQNIVKQR